MNKRIKAMNIFFALLLALSASVGCGSPSETEQALEYANALLKAVEAFEAARHDTSQQINQTTNRITDMAATAKSNMLDATSDQKGNTVVQSTQTPKEGDAAGSTTPVIELSGLAKAWEEEWRTVHTHFDELEAKFSEVGEKSVAYFGQLEAIKEGISDANLKMEEETKNKELSERWTKAFQQASADIGELRKLIIIGDDFEKVLRLAALRGTLEEDIKQLQEISSQAQTLLVQVEQLTVAGRELTSGLTNQSS